MVLPEVLGWVPEVLGWVPEVLGWVPVPGRKLCLLCGSAPGIFEQHYDFSNT